MVSPSPNTASSIGGGSDATIDIISGAGTRVLLAIPPGSETLPFASPSSSPNPPSVMVSVSTLSPSSSPSREVALIQVVAFTFQYCAGDVMLAGYVRVTVIVSPGVRPVTFQDMNPKGNATPEGLVAFVKLASEIAVMFENVPLLVDIAIVPFPVAESIEPIVQFTVMVTVALSNPPTPSDIP